MVISIGMTIEMRVVVKQIDTLLRGKVKVLSAMLTSSHSVLWVEENTGHGISSHWTHLSFYPYTLLPR